MSLNSGNGGAVDLRWRRQRKALDKDRANKRAYARYVVIKVAEDMEEDIARLAAKAARQIGIDLAGNGSDRSVLVVGRQLGRNLYIDSMLRLQDETRFLRITPPELNEAALSEIERILDDYEAAVTDGAENAGALGVESLRSDLREFFGVRSGATGGVEQKHR